MTTSRLPIRVPSTGAFWRDRTFQGASLAWLLVGLPYVLPLLSKDHLRIHSEFWVDTLLIPVAVLATLSGVRSLESRAERRFWRLLAAALVCIGLAAVGFWLPVERFPVALAIDLFYLAFYLLLSIAALTAPHREDRTQLRESGNGAVGAALLLGLLLSYFVLIPGTLDSPRYQTWLPSMYLFVTLDLFVFGLFVRQFRQAKTARWRLGYGLIGGALAAWAIVDLLESLSWAGISTIGDASALNLLWTVPLALLLVAARARHGQSEREHPAAGPVRTDPVRPVTNQVALTAAVGFPLMHICLNIAGLLEPALNEAREVLVVLAIVSLGSIAMFERQRIGRARSRDQRRRQHAETALRESEARYRTLVEHAPEAIVILDPETLRFVDCNDRALDLFKLERQKMLASGPADLSPPQQPSGESSAQAARSYIERALSGEIGHFDWLHQDSTGAPIHCEIHLVAMPSKGKPLIRGSLIDVTDDLALRDQLRESRRLEALGRLAGGVAHDFNNLLTVITGYSDLALESRGLSREVRHMLGEIKGAGSKAARLIAQLLAFGRRQTSIPMPLDLNRSVRDLEALLRRLLGEDLDLQIELEANLPEIFADPAQLEQVIVNLAMNGRDAMPEGGELQVETGRVRLETPHRHGSRHAPAGLYGRISFRDNGIGMDEATKSRVFEPFFTTKRLGEGTGLGLATVYGIVAQSHGYITVESSRHQGSNFCVHFPMAPAGAAAGSATTVPGGDFGSPRGRETVLFVEDEDSIRSLQSSGLRALGYDVVGARDADQALTLVTGDPGGVEVLVTDVVLPGLSGPDLADRVRLLAPEIKVIFVSGYANDFIRRKRGLAEEVPFLQKPFSPIDLARKIRGVLEAA